MKRSNYLIWFRRLAVLGAVVAGLTASAAGAHPMLDPQDTPASPVVSNTTALGLRADGLRWQAIAKAYQQNRPAPIPDVIERYAATHPYGQGAFARELATKRIVDADPVVSHTTALGLRADGLRLQAIAKAYQENEQAPPDVIERYVATHSTAGYPPAATSGNGGLDWGDFGIGAGAMLGLALLVTGLSVGTAGMRHRAGKLGTS